jgi:L-glyceraldehyde 3-phosphate reductase
MGLDYVDIFYSHRPDPDTPMEETMSALATAVQSGRALYAGISSYDAEQTEQATAILASMGVRMLIHQPSYSILDRWITGGLLDSVERLGLGCIAFSPLAQGLLTSRYLDGIPPGSRASKAGSLSSDLLTVDMTDHLRALNEIASGRGQTLAQMALSWVLADARVTSALIGASSIAQLEENLAAASAPPFTDAELAAIDEHSSVPAD